MGKIDRTYLQQINRNIGIISEKQQLILNQTKIAVAGCGADGGSTAVSLARFGIKSFHLADPDYFDISNINRQEGAFHSNIGLNKSEVIKKIILDIQPNAQVTVFNKGINNTNLNKFIEGVDLLIEEIDYRLPNITNILHQAARGQKIPIFTGVSVAWNAFLFYFSPTGMTFEEYSNFQPKKQSNKHDYDIDYNSYVPETPDYISTQIIKKVISKKIEIPAVDSAVRLASSLISTYSIFHLTGIKKIEPVPYYYSAGDLFHKNPNFNSRIITKIDNK